MNPLAALPEIPTAQPGVLHDVTSEVTPIVYGMWMRMLRSLPVKAHSRIRESESLSISRPSSADQSAQDEDRDEADEPPRRR